MTCVTCVTLRKIFCVVTIVHELFIHSVTYQLYTKTYWGEKERNHAGLHRLNMYDVILCVSCVQKPVELHFLCDE